MMKAKHMLLSYVANFLKIKPTCATKGPAVCCAQVSQLL